MSLSPEVEVYQIRVYLRQISPMIWRRLLVQSDSTIADLYYTLQISMGWTDSHLNRFVIRGQELPASIQEKMVKHQAEESGFFSCRSRIVMLAKAGIHSLECEDGFLPAQE